MVTKVKQRDLTDCGAACIASICGHYGLNIPVSQIRQYASTDQKGTNVLGLLEAFQKLGFDAKGVKGEHESLFKVPKPAIAHVLVKDRLYHYVVICRTTKKYIEVMDPADGEIHKHQHSQFKKMWTGILVIMIPDHTFQSQGRSISVLSRFLTLLRPHSGTMIQALTGALVYTLIGLTTSIYVQKIVDHVIVDGNTNLLNLMSIIMVLLVLMQIFIGAMKSIFTLRSGQMIDAQLILGYYRHLLRLPQQFFDTMRVGEIISRINDAVNIRVFINEVLINISVSIFILIFSFALMFTYYWKLAIIILLIVPLFAIVYVITNLLNKKVERSLMEKSAHLESQLVESLQSIFTIKSFGLENHTNLKTELKFVSLLKTVHSSTINNIFTSTSTELISRMFTVVLLWTGAGFVLRNEITPGELLSFYALIGYFTGPVSSIIGLNKVIQNALIAADRLFEIMDLELENDKDKVKLTADMVGDIHFKNLHFRYGSRVKVFEGFSLMISRSAVTAIVGESGCGKSTLISILQNIYPIQNGNIFIGEYDLKYIQIESLRRLIGVVPQKLDLFAGNVIDNIAVGEPQPDLKKVLSVCSDLGILRFIEDLPNGLYTYFGENGTTLSGGQKQSLAIARALYKDPEILILDEATSSLDTTSEQYIQRMIHQLRENQKTVILIAHRLSTVCHADKIVVLENGKVSEEGTHEELLARQKKYYSLWKQQFPMLEKVPSFH